MAAVTPPLLSDSEDDYQIIDNGPINLALLDSAQLEARDVEYPTQLEDEVYEEQVVHSSETGKEEEKKIERMLKELLEKALIDATATHMGGEKHLEEANVKSFEAVADEIVEVEVQERKKNSAAIKKVLEECPLGLYLISGMMFVCFLAAVAGWNANHNQQIQTYEVMLAQYKTIERELNTTLKWKIEEVKILSKYYEHQRDTVLREKKIAIAGFEAEKDRLNNIINETTGENLRMEPYRNVTLNEWTFKVHHVFVLNVTRGEGIRQGDQIFAINDVPVKGLPFGSEVADKITKAGSPVRLVVRYNPHGLKTISQVLNLQEEWAKTSQVA